MYSINLKTGKVNWFKKYNSPSVGPNGVTVVGGVVYGATGDSAFALQASTGEQLWIKKLTRNNNEGIDMAPGFEQRHASTSRPSPATPRASTRATARRSCGP